MSLPPLNLRITADASELQGALNRTKRLVKGFAVAAVAGLAAVTTGLAAMTAKGLAAVDAQTKLARSIDGTVNGLRAVQLAGSDAGVSLGELNTSLQQMNRELVRAEEQGSPAAEALGKLGLSGKRLRDLDVDDRLALIADRAKELGLSAGQTSDIMRDLGVRSREMALLLNQGGDAIRSAREEVAEFGLELTETQTSAIERTNDAISRLSLIFESLSQRLAADVAPILETVASRFNDLAKSQLAQDAIERLTTAFATLADTILSEDFLSVAVSGIETLASVMGGAADIAVTLSQNVEVVTGALTAAAIAAAALGGPLTIVIGLLGGALVGIATLRKRAREAAGGVDAAKEATNRLNEALGTFSDTASPAAAREARDLAQANIDIKDTALQAARAELAKAEAIAESDFRVGNPGSGPDAVDLRRQQSQDRVDALEEEIAALEELEVKLSEVARVGGVRPRARPMDGGAETEDEEDQVTDIPGLGGPGAVKEQLDGRLEVLMAGLQTEREALMAWREEGMELLREALENEVITEEEYRQKKEELEAAHQERMRNLKERERRVTLRGMKSAFSDLASLTQSENDKLFKIGKAAAIARATITGIEAAIDAHKRGMEQPYIGGPALAAAYTAASLAKTGAMISNIASQSSSGGGGSAGRGGAGAAAEPVVNTQRVDLNIIGGTDRDRMVASTIIDTLNDAQRDGFRLDPRLIGVQ